MASQNLRRKREGNAPTDFAQSFLIFIFFASTAKDEILTVQRYLLCSNLQCVQANDYAVRTTKEGFCSEMQQAKCMSFESLPWVVYSLDENHSVGLDTAAGHTCVPRVLPSLAGQPQQKLEVCFPRARM